MPNQPRISVIIPCYNQVRYVERAITSVIDQSYKNLELIVIDGGSDDGSERIIALYDEDIAYWQSEKDTGPAEAINIGLQRATGDIIAMLHADDIYMPGTLESISQTMSDTSETLWATSHTLRIDERDQHLGQTFAQAPSAERWGRYLLQEEGVLPLQGSFYKRELFERHGGFETDYQHAFSFAFHARLLRAGHEPKVLEFVGVAQREHGRSRSANQAIEAGIEHIEAALKHGENLLAKERFELWESCDERRRIYTIAASESQKSEHRAFLWQKLLRRSWWLASARYRASLLRGVLEPIELPMRKAA